MIFKRKAYEELKKWKEKYGKNYAAFLEGPRRVGKSTIAEEFAKNEFKSYIKIDFANVKQSTLDIFNDIADLNRFFLRLQLETGVTLYEGESVIVFDEIQKAPLVRQAIKYLVLDGRYYFIETGSLISIRQNVKDIVIPSEEYKIPVYPMDYEEFLSATGNTSYSVLRKLYSQNAPIGECTHRKLMRDFRLYMAVGGMPQAVDCYVQNKNFEEIDMVKRRIIDLYEEDFKKIDPTGRISRLFHSIPSQLMTGKKRFVISNTLKKKTTSKDEELLSDMLDSKTVIISYNTTEVNLSLNLNRTIDSYKLFLADTGLLVTMLFKDEGGVYKDIYSKLLSDKLDINLGYLFENMVAQMIASSGRNLFYHTWRKENSTHQYKVNFLIIKNGKISPIEVKSSSVRYHSSITEFAKKYSSQVNEQYLISQKDVGKEGMLKLKPIYLLPFILETD